MKAIVRRSKADYRSFYSRMRNGSDSQESVSHYTRVDVYDYASTGITVADITRRLCPWLNAVPKSVEGLYTEVMEMLGMPGVQSSSPTRHHILEMTAGSCWFVYHSIEDLSFDTLGAASTSIWLLQHSSIKTPGYLYCYSSYFLRQSSRDTWKKENLRKRNELGQV